MIGQTVQEARVHLDANARGRRLGNLTAGRVDSRNLAKRIPQQDPRMFQRKLQPKRKSYEFILGFDCSGSTATSDRISRIKRAVYGQAETLTRLGIPFSIYAHSAGWYVDPDADEMPSMDVWIFDVKQPNEPWNAATKTRLAEIRPQAGNLDGHTLEFYRKVAERSGATDVAICYYTDGAMPASNYDEELEILQREIRYCLRQGISLLAVGIDTSSPEEHGFETVRVDTDADLPKVIRQLGKQLT